MLPVRIVAVVTHYQTLKETRACLASLGGQVDRIVVVDNGSEPPFLGAEVIRSSRNLGFAGGCNFGIRSAGEYDAILLLNSDAEAAPGCVARLAEVLAARPEAGLGGPGILRGGAIGW